MTKDQITEYLLKNEQARYECAKELQKTLRVAILSVLGAITLIVLGYMYFVVPVEEVTVDGNSNAAIHTVVDNGSQVWQ